MKKIIDIIEVKEFFITCRFNNGRTATVNVKPLLDSQKHLQGIEKLYEKAIFKKVRIGKMGELLWDNIITTVHNNETSVWDYDISPELVWSLDCTLLAS